MFSCELTLDEVKRRLVLDMFPSYEDGNPDNYDIYYRMDRDGLKIIISEKDLHND